MARTVITATAANDLLRGVFELPVSLPWKGHVSAIFLELGNLAPLTRPKQRRQCGEAMKVYREFVTIACRWYVSMAMRIFSITAFALRPRLRSMAGW